MGRSDVGADVLAQVTEDVADGLQLDAGIEQGLDDAELEEVLVAVLTAAAAPRGVGDRWADQVGPCPVVELPIGDPDDLGRLRPAVSESPCFGICVLLLVYRIRLFQIPQKRISNEGFSKWKSVALP